MWVGDHRLQVVAGTDTIRDHQKFIHTKREMSITVVYHKVLVVRGQDRSTLMCQYLLRLGGKTLQFDTLSTFSTRLMAKDYSPSPNSTMRKSQVTSEDLMDISVEGFCRLSTITIHAPTCKCKVPFLFIQSNRSTHGSCKMCDGTCNSIHAPCVMYIQATQP